MKKSEMTELGAVQSVLSTATVMHVGWEMDNEAWAVEVDGGKRAIIGTSHGRAIVWDRKKAMAKLRETEKSAEGLRELLRILDGKEVRT